MTKIRQLPILLVILYFKDISCPSPDLLLCKPVYHIAWRDTKPFLDRKEANHTGLIPHIFEAALRGCCRGDFYLNYSVEYRSQNEMMDIQANYTVDFVMPVSTDVTSKKFLHYPFVSVVESPGIAFYVVPSQSLSEAIILAITSAGPLIMIMFLMVAISGTAFWIVETTFLIYAKQASLSFFEGVGQGIWWAFVSMTTVGYGDVFPKTKPGKVFSIIWVLTGVAFCALFTSYITTILTSACLQQNINLYGAKVGVVHGSEEHKFALKKNAIPKVHERVGDFVDSLLERKVSGALIDSYIASENQNTLSQFRLQAIIEHVTSNGVVFQNQGLNYVQCIRDYMLSRQGDIYREISKRIKPIKISKTSAAEEKSQQLFDPQTPGFYIPVFSALITLVIVFSIGCIWEWRRQQEIRQKKVVIENNVDPRLTLSQWRTCYKHEFNDMVKDIKKDTDLIQNKCLVLMNKLNIQGYNLSNIIEEEVRGH